jgi:hypothetical protein
MRSFHTLDRGSAQVGLIRQRLLAESFLQTQVAQVHAKGLDRGWVFHCPEGQSTGIQYSYRIRYILQSNWLCLLL